MSNNEKLKVKKKGLFFRYLLLCIIIIAVVIALFYKFKQTTLFINLKEGVTSFFSKEQKEEDISLEEQQQQKIIVDLETLKNQNIDNANLISKIETVLDEIRGNFVASAQRDYVNYVIASYKLVGMLESDYPFSGQIDLLYSLSRNVELKDSLVAIMPEAKEGIQTAKTLSNQFSQDIYKELYLSFYRDRINLKSRIMYYISHLVFIKNVNNNRISSGDIRYKLNNIQSYLDQGKLKEAYDSVVGLQLKQNAKIGQWLSNLQKRINANKAIKLININIDNYANRG